MFHFICICRWNHFVRVVALHSGVSVFAKCSIFSSKCWELKKCVHHSEKGWLGQIPRRPKTFGLWKLVKITILDLAIPYFYAGVRTEASIFGVHYFFPDSVYLESVFLYSVYPDSVYSDSVFPDSVFPDTVVQDSVFFQACTRLLWCHVPLPNRAGIC